MAAANNPQDRRNSHTQLLEKLQELSKSIYHTNTSSMPSSTTTDRRTNSLVLSRPSIPPILSISDHDHEFKLNPKAQSWRMPLSWHFLSNDKKSQKQQTPIKDNNDSSSSSEKKRGLWNWKPIRVLSHIGKQKLSCLLSVEVVTVQGLPVSMTGLRLGVSVRKNETKDGGVQTMPSRVSQGSADFEEILFIRCHVYFTQQKLEPRPFVIQVFAVDAKELVFGRYTVDLSELIRESMEKNFEGTRIRQWDTSFSLSGKAKGGELVMKLGFQIMEKDGGVPGHKSGKAKSFLPSIGRRGAKSSFSVPSRRIPNSQGGVSLDFQETDDSNLDEPLHEWMSATSVQMTDDNYSVSSEVVKEIVHDRIHPELNVQIDEEASVPNLGKGLGCVILTRNEGYLVAMNPLKNLVGEKNTPKLAMQISRPMVLLSNESSGTEMFRQMAAIGFEELGSKILALMSMEELVGKTAEQIAFEGIASAIISSRNKEGAFSVVKSMETGKIRKISDKTLRGDEILAFSLRKLEEMAIEALKVQADMTDEDAPYDVSPTLMSSGEDSNHPLTNAVALEDWMKDNSVVTSPNKDDEIITISVLIQMRDPSRQYEAVGAPLVALIHATAVEVEPAQNYDEEKRFKVTSLNVGGLKLKSGGKWDTEKQRLTAIQWLVGNGVEKGRKKGKRVAVKGPDFLWSISSVIDDTWLKPIRNPDVKFTK